MFEDVEITPVRVAAAADLHCKEDSAGQFRPWLSLIKEQADVLILCGDLTDYGKPEEARVLAAELQAVGVPIVAVLGNHDVESGKANEVQHILCDAGVRILGGDVTSIEIVGIGFTGTKGFMGGFGARTLGPWGEPVVKGIVQEALDETLKLETGLARLRTHYRVVLLHYSPIRGTVEGEPLEIYPFLGCSRLEEPILRYPVNAVFHGHAHRGSLQGSTANGVPVYNVAVPLLLRSFPEKPPFRVIELSLPV
jgi:Icc-related predicted phosphoesterase